MSSRTRGTPKRLEDELQSILDRLDECFDVCDRADRLVGIIYGNGGQIQQRALTLDLLVQLRAAGVEYDARDRNWFLNFATDSVSVAPMAVAVFDVNLMQVLGAPLAAANPVISGIYDAAGNRMPAMDNAIRPGYMDIIDRWARQLGQVDLARVLGVALAPANPVIAGIYDAAGNRMPTMDAVARAGYVDVTDRAARLLGVIYGSQGQQLLQRAATFDSLVQLRTAGVEYDARDRNWVLGVLDVPDLSDRWARQLGQVDLARVSGGALAAANPVIVGLFDAAGNRMPAMDNAIRPGYVDTIDRAARVLGTVDVTDRAARLLGVVYGSQGAQLLQRAATFDLQVQLRTAGVEYDARTRTWNLGAADVPDLSDRAARLVGRVYGSQGSQLLQRAATFDLQVQLRNAGVEIDPRDVSDRWARQLGQVDIARVLGAALSAANPLIAGIYDAAGNRMPTMDAAVRRGYISLTDGANFMPTMDAAARRGYFSLTDGANFMPTMDARARAGYVYITDGGNEVTIDGSNRMEVTPYQATRASLRVKPEREDLSIYEEDVAAVGAGNTELLAAVPGQSHKIFACGYESDAGVQCGFRFGAGSRWGRRVTAGVYAQSFPNPVVGAANTALNFYCGGACNAYTWVHYITEA